MKAVVTGGLGSLGTYLVRRLAYEGCQVVVYDNLSKKETQYTRKLLSGLSGVEIEVADCLDVTDYGEVDIIFHLAGDVSTVRSLREPVRSFRTNAMVTCCVLEAARRYLTPVIYASSFKVYPNEQGQYTPYGLGKWAGDLLCTEYARTFGVPTLSNRFGAIYGVHQYGTAESGWLSWFVRATVQQLPLELHGGGLQERDCLHNEDVARLLITQAGCLISTRDCNGKTYDVGGGHANFVSLVKVLEYLRDNHGYSLEHVTMIPRRHADVEGRPAKNVRVLQDFGWTPMISIWAGIDEMVEAERNR